MKQNAVRAPAGLELADHHARLRIHHQDAVAIQVGRIEQAAVRRKGNIADEILRAALGLRHHREGSRGREDAVGESEFEKRGLRASAHVNPVALRREGKSEPAVGHRNASRHSRRCGLDHADRGRPVAAVQHQQVLAVGREGRRHGQRVERDLAAHRIHTPSAVEQERRRPEAAPPVRAAPAASRAWRQGETKARARAMRYFSEPGRCFMSTSHCKGTAGGGRSATKR